MQVVKILERLILGQLCCENQFADRYLMELYELGVDIPGSVKIERLSSAVFGKLVDCL